METLTKKDMIPCPFCDGHDDDLDLFMDVDLELFVTMCNACGCVHYGPPEGPRLNTTREKAVKNWNDRAETD